MSAAATGVSPEQKGALLMAGGGALLGTLGVFVEEAAQHPLTTVLFRCAFGALSLLLWGAVSGRLPELRLRGPALLPALAAGILMAINWALFFGAIQRTSIALATVVFHVQPLWVLAFGAWFLHERVTRARAGAVVVALAGLVLATGLLDESLLGRTPGAHDVGRSTRYLVGVAMCLGGSLSYAGVILIAKTARSVSSFSLAFWQCIVGAVLFAWWPLVRGWPSFGSTWAWLAGLGVIHTGIAYVVLYAGMSRLPTSRIAILQFVYPATAILMDWSVYHRALSTLQMGGVALMGFALWAVRSSAA